MAKGFCKGANFKFQDRGAYELPGAEDPVKIYEVFWNGGTTDGPVAGDPPAEEKNLSSFEFMKLYPSGETLLVLGVLIGGLVFSQGNENC